MFNGYPAASTSKPYMTGARPESSNLICSPLASTRLFGLPLLGQDDMKIEQLITNDLLKSNSTTYEPFIGAENMVIMKKGDRSFNRKFIEVKSLSEGTPASKWQWLQNRKLILKRLKEAVASKSVRYFPSLCYFIRRIDNRYFDFVFQSLERYSRKLRGISTIYSFRKG